jgi:hypothetical protein
LPQANQLWKERENIEKLEQQIAKHKEEVALLNATSLTSLQKLTYQLAAKETLIKSLRAKSIARTITRVGTSSQPKPFKINKLVGPLRSPRKGLQTFSKLSRQKVREGSSAANPTLPF